MKEASSQQRYRKLNFLVEIKEPGLNKVLVESEALEAP
jgi:hypothetical protein